MSNIDLIEFSRLENRLSNAPFTVNKEFLKILRDVLKEGANSSFLQIVDGTTIDCNSHNSQCRAINIDPKNLAEIKNDAAARGIENPAFIYQLPSNSKYKYGLINGRHRIEAASSLQIKTPAVVISYSVFTNIISIMAEIQAILNDNKPSKSNNENDLKKHIRRIVERDGINLENDLQYERLLRRLEFCHKGISRNAIKNNLTRIKKAIKQERSDVFCAKGETFKQLYSQNNIVTLNEETKVVSTRGSSLDQEWPRSVRLKAEHPRRKLTWIYSDNNNNGDSQSVIDCRKSFFERLHKTVKCFNAIYGKNVLPFDTLIIAPQIKSEFTFFFNDEEVTSQAEVVNDQKCWKRITAQQILEAFEEKKSYREEFIFAKKISKNDKKAS